VATKQSTSTSGSKGGTSKGGSSKSGSSKSGATKASGSKSSTSNTASTKGAKSVAAPRSRVGARGAKVSHAFREHVGDRRQDAWGLLLVLVAVIAALGIWGDAAGPVGAFLSALTHSLVGQFAVLAPLVVGALGVAIVFDRPAAELGRFGVGGTLVSIAVLGGWHLIRGAPHVSDGIVGLHAAAGLAGFGIGRPLVLGLSVTGAWAVLVFLFALGALVLSRTSLQSIGGRARAWLMAVPSDGDNEPVSTARATKASKAQQVDGADGDVPATPKRRRSSAKANAVIGDVDASRTASTSASAEPFAGPPVAARRATVGLNAKQSPLPGTTDDGLTEADRLAGRTPAPPTPDGGGPRKATALKPAEDWAEYRLPDLQMLAVGKAVGDKAHAHIEAQAAALQETLEQFKIDATVARWSRGPTVTQFEIELGPGVSVKKVGNLGDDIAYALAAPDVRIVAPIPGKSAIGVEVPNRSRDLITLGDILRSDVAKSNTHPLFVALGVDIAGNPAMVNLAKMPHLLVAGATGSGKSVTLNAMITSIVTRARPDQVRMILIDPKQVELNAYDGAPHLLTPVVTDPRRAADAVAWCVKEMEMRYDTLARLGYRDIDSYNEAVANGEIATKVTDRLIDPDTAEAEIASYKHMPYVLLVIDELADLMMVAGRDVEEAICRIAQKARAIGIHMVIATQRPSVDVITGLIKANIPSRLALMVSSQIDSRTILDGGGAEKLVGHGDMLFKPASQGSPSRLQGCFIHEREITPIVEFCKSQREATFVDGVVTEGPQAATLDASRRAPDDDSDEALLLRAADQIVTSGLGSVSMLQRKLRIGFARAGRLMDELEEMGVVGENEGSKAREVLWSPEMLDEARASGLL
jgi:S-DNA-T family DNA segregation ATPase FtsK/SpoIIIE